MWEMEQSTMMPWFWLSFNRTFFLGTWKENGEEGQERWEEEVYVCT